MYKGSEKLNKLRLMRIGKKSKNVKREIKHLDNTNIKNLKTDRRDIFISENIR